jgi:hypothetical protein
MFRLEAVVLFANKAKNADIAVAMVSIFNAISGTKEQV